MISLSDGLAGLALLVSGLSFWYAKTEPRRARQSALRDDLRREIGAFQLCLEGIASDIRQGHTLADTSGELTAIPRRVHELSGRVDVSGLDVGLLRANMVLFQSRWFMARNLQTRIESTQSHVDAISSHGQGDDARRSYIDMQKDELRRLERALPPAISTLTQEVERMTGEVTLAVQALNKADKR